MVSGAATDSRSKCKVTLFSFNHVFGLAKSVFLSWPVFNFSMMFLTYSLEIPLKSVFFGIYCLMSPFMFSMAPFSHEQYGCAK